MNDLSGFIYSFIYFFFPCFHWLFLGQHAGIGFWKTGLGNSSQFFQDLQPLWKQKKMPLPATHLLKEKNCSKCFIEQLSYFDVNICWDLSHMMTNILSFNFKQIICVYPIMHLGKGQYGYFSLVTIELCRLWVYMVGKVEVTLDQGKVYYGRCAIGLLHLSVFITCLFLFFPFSVFHL